MQRNTAGVSHKPLVTVFCGLLMAAGAFSIDVLLPSLPTIALDLEASTAQVQWSISLFILAAGISQLLWGPLSDHLGRRPTLIAGLTLYLLGLVIMFIIPTIEGFLIGRILQGAGTGSTNINSRAIIRDLFSGPELARSMATATAVFASGPIVAPLLGAIIAWLGGWQWIIGVMAILGAILMVLVISFLPESRPSNESSKEKSIEHQGKAAGAPTNGRVKPTGGGLARRVMADFKIILCHRQSAYFLMISVIISISMILIVSVLPNLFKVAYGVEGIEFAILFALHGIGIVVGQVVNRKLILRYGILFSMKVGSLVLVLAGTLILSFYLSALDGPWVISACLTLFATSFLIIFANSTSLILDPHPTRAGSAACLQGVLSMGGAGTIVSLLILQIGDSFAGFSITLLVICLLSCLGVFAWPKVSRGK